MPEKPVKLSGVTVSSTPVGRGRYVVEYEKNNPYQPYQSNNAYLNKYAPGRVKQLEVSNRNEWERKRNNYVDAKMREEQRLANIGKRSVMSGMKYNAEQQEAVIKTQTGMQINWANQDPLTKIAKVGGEVALAIAPELAIMKYSKGISNAMQLKKHYNSLPIMNNGSPILEALDRGIMKAGDNIVYNAQRANSKVQDFGKGVSIGLKDNRPFFIKFPVTKAQKQAVIAEQDAAFKRGVKFTEDWFYDEGYLRHGVKQRLENILDEPLREIRSDPFTNISYLSVRKNPIATSKNIITTSSSSSIKKLNIPKELKNEIITERHTMGGINSKGNSITFRNIGPYYKKPSDIQFIAAHETGHSAQKLGGLFANSTDGQFTLKDKYFGSMLAKSDKDVSDYFFANPDTKIGQRFAKAMVNPEKPVKKWYGNRTKGNNWYASPNEVHSDLMGQRSLIYDELTINRGYDHDEALRILGNPTDKMLDAMLDGRMSRFFKPETPIEERRALLKLLPATIPAAYGVSLAKKNNNNNTSTQ